MEKKLLYINRKEAEKEQKIGALAALRHIELLQPKEEELEGLPEDAELMKLIGFTGAELGDFLSALRLLGLRVDYKCTETESNRSWSLRRLYEELREEHESMKRYQERKRV